MMTTPLVLMFLGMFTFILSILYMDSTIGLIMRDTAVGIVIMSSLVSILQLVLYVS